MDLCAWSAVQHQCGTLPSIGECLKKQQLRRGEKQKEGFYFCLMSAINQISLFSRNENLTKKLLAAKIITVIVLLCVNSVDVVIEIINDIPVFFQAFPFSTSFNKGLLHIKDLEET